jgi:hypothetical protein
MRAHYPPGSRGPTVTVAAMSRPKVYDERRITTAVRLPESLHGWLKSAARERDVSVTYLVVRALEDYRDGIAPLTRPPAGR